MINESLHKQYNSNIPEDNGGYTRKAIQRPVKETMEEEYRRIMWKYLSLIILPFTVAIAVGLVVLFASFAYNIDQIFYEKLLTYQQEIHALSSEVKELRMLLDMKNITPDP